MAHLKGIDSKPMFVSSRLCTLVINGGDLNNLYDSPRFEQRNNRSRNASNITKKDFRINCKKVYRPWQFYQSRGLCYGK